MIKFTFLIIVGLISFDCNAASCVISEESVLEQSRKYKSLVQIEITKNDALLTVVLQAPRQIEGKTLESVILHNNISSGANAVFTVPLRVTVEKNMAVAWFNIDEKTANHAFLSLDYGDECGTPIRYNISH